MDENPETPKRGFQALQTCITGFKHYADSLHSGGSRVQHAVCDVAAAGGTRWGRLPRTVRREGL